MRLKEGTHSRGSDRARSLANGSDSVARDGYALGVDDVARILDFGEHELAFVLTNLEVELAKLVEQVLEDLQVRFLIRSEDNDIIYVSTHRMIPQSDD